MAFRHPARVQQACDKPAKPPPAQTVAELDDVKRSLEAERARLDAEKSTIASDCERIHREAAERGYRDGQAKARQEYEKTIEPLLLGLIDDLRHRTGELDRMLHEADTKIIALICTHAVALAKRLIGVHYDAHPESIAQSLAPLLRDVAAERQAGHKIVCTAHPQTLRLLSSITGDLAASGLVLVADDTMQPGGAKLTLRDIDANRTVAEWDATLERRIAHLGSPA
jgi:flagellar biosynthesis/type III secretory pathway protein FliH